MDLRTAANMLRINRHRLDDELEIQSEVMFRVAECKATASDKMTSTKDNLLRVEGKLYFEIKRDDPKATKDAVEAEIVRDPDRVRAFESYRLAKDESERWDSMYESWKQRGFALKTLADLYAANYFNVETTTSGRREVSTRDYDSNRESLARKRNEESRGRRTLLE